MDYKLANFGWGAVCVKGFLPPAAFMELQSLGILKVEMGAGLAAVSKVLLQ